MKQKFTIGQHLYNGYAQTNTMGNKHIFANVTTEKCICSQISRTYFIIYHASVIVLSTEHGPTGEL